MRGHRVGLVTHPAWLVAWSSNSGNDPIRRGKWIYEHLLAGKIPEVPITVERAVLSGGTIRHLLEPEYHGDVIRGQGRVLCFRNYGLDIVERLKACGFRDARLVPADGAARWGFGAKVVVAEK